jgi:hypothetical protein
MSDDLVERVALAFCGKDVPCKMCRNDAKKAIAIALEEAARVAENARRATYYDDEIGKLTTDLIDAKDIAAAIRAMMRKSNAD